MGQESKTIVCREPRLLVATQGRVRVCAAAYSGRVFVSSPKSFTLFLPSPTIAEVYGMAFI